MNPCIHSVFFPPDDRDCISCWALQPNLSLEVLTLGAGHSAWLTREQSIPFPLGSWAVHDFPAPPCLCTQTTWSENNLIAHLIVFYFAADRGQTPFLQPQPHKGQENQRLNSKQPPFLLWTLKCIQMLVTEWPMASLAQHVTLRNSYEVRIITYLTVLLLVYNKRHFSICHHR